MSVSSSVPKIAYLDLSAMFERYFVTAAAAANIRPVVVVLCGSVRHCKNIYLGTDLVTALAGLNVYDLPHVCRICKELKKSLEKLKLRAWLFWLVHDDCLARYREIKWLRYGFCRFSRRWRVPRAAAPADALAAPRLVATLQCCQPGHPVRLRNNDFSRYFRWIPFLPLFEFQWPNR